MSWCKFFFFKPLWFLFSFAFIIITETKKNKKQTFQTKEKFELQHSIHELLGFFSQLLHVTG